ncbi:P12 family lipoprotein [Borreliella bavariensis]|uniref:P12 family lipoprotein n=1 Tax=Borreliella bavariensis TaxID=664662 RepID=UPI001BFFF178|nr:P12 family lipoprotein [Borreliella bavariensis]
MRKGLFLYILLIVGLMSCNLDSKLSGNKEQKNNNNAKGASDSVKEYALNDLYSNQEEQKGFTKNLGEQKYEDLIDPVAPSVSLNNRVNIANISIDEHAQKKEIKKEDLIPSTDEEKRADEAIKDLGNILGNSKFSELIEEVRALKDEYALIKADLHDVLVEKIQNKKTPLMGNYKNNRDKINKLAKLEEDNLKIDSELEKLINKINIAENEIISAALFFDKANKRLEESIIKRLESRNKRSDALKLSRQALSDARSALSNLESFFSNRIEAIVRKKEIKELITHAKTVVASLNKK